MGPPASANDFLDLLRRSGLIEDRLLDAHLQKLRETGALPDQAVALARLLLRDGLLTKFQAEQLLQGRWIGLQRQLLHRQRCTAVHHLDRLWQLLP